VSVSPSGSVAVALKPTKQLAPYQSGLLDALQFRITGLQCFSERLGAAWAVKKPLVAGAQLSTCVGELYASDYVYAELFANGANAALKQVGAAGVPTSQFLSASDVNLVTPAGIGLALQRLHPGAVKGIHGTELGTVVATPQGLTLQPGTQNQVNELNHEKQVISQCLDLLGQANDAAAKGDRTNANKLAAQAAPICDEADTYLN